MPMKETTCPNCGAAFGAEETKCPYCGHINPAGAEAEFMRNLEKTRLDLDHVDEESRASYTGAVKKTAGSAVRIFLIALIAVVVIAGGFLLLEKTIFSTDQGNYAEELAWEHQRFEEYDDMFSAGEYEKLLEAIAADGEDHEVWNWEHYDELMEIADKMYEQDGTDR